MPYERLTDADWRAKARNILKAELAQRDLSYADLADELADIGCKADRRVLTNKRSTGVRSPPRFSFSA
jgi:hypothetical protein